MAVVSRDAADTGSLRGAVMLGAEGESDLTTDPAEPGGEGEKGGEGVEEADHSAAKSVCGGGEREICSWQK